MSSVQLCSTELFWANILHFSSLVAYAATRLTQRMQKINFRRQQSLIGAFSSKN